MVNQDRKEFVINSHLTLKLENGKTIIYIDNEEFLICKTAILDIPKDIISEIKSIDDIIDVSKIVEKEDLAKYKITSLTEFWAHCSNLQIWAENEYNSDFLDSRLTFPLLKRLTEVGDRIAKKKFKEEIARRYAHGTYDTKSFLEFEGFLDDFTMEELIIGGLSFEESSLLLDIIEFMKKKEITYEMVLSFDEDKVRHRLSSSERFLTLENGDVYIFEFDLFDNSAHLFNRFSSFKGMRNLIIFLGDLKEQLPDFSKIKCKSIIALEISHYSFSEIPSKIFFCFPNLEYLRIYSPFKPSLKNVDSIISLEKLKMIRINDCLDGENYQKILSLKKRGVEIKN